jgi:PAS domain S-box-containing protein
MSKLDTQLLQESVTISSAPARSTRELRFVRHGGDPQNAIDDARKRADELQRYLCRYRTLYLLNQLGEHRVLSLDTYLEEAAKLIPSAWPAAQHVTARIIYEGKVYSSPGYETSDYLLTADMVLNQCAPGQIEVSIQAEKAIPGPELSESQNLTDYLAAEIAAYVQRYLQDQALRRSGILLNDLFDYSHEGIVLHRDGIIEKAGSAFATMLGYRPDELTNRCLWDLMATDPAEQSSSQDRSGPYEAQWRRKDDSLIWGEIRHNPESANDDGCQIAFVRDLSPVKELDSKRQEALEVLRVSQDESARKDIAMREVLGQVGSEKERLGTEIGANIERVIMPLLQSLRTSHNSAANETIGILEHCLRDIASPFVGSLQNRYSNLTSRELEICSLIKNGFSSKEIAVTLHISLLTVHKFRQLIRKKLKLTNKEANLASSLRNL